MQVITTIDNTNYLATLNGPEMELLAKILSKLTKVDRQYIAGTYYDIPGDKLAYELKVGGEVEQISRAEYDEKLAEAQRADRQRLVARINDPSLIGDKHTSAVSELKSALYYVDCWPYSERDEVSYEPGSMEHGVVDFIRKDGSTVRVNASGSIDVFPVVI